MKELFGLMVEYLTNKQGFDTVHSFIGIFIDSVGSTSEIITQIEIGTFNEIEIAQIIEIIYN